MVKPHYKLIPMLNPYKTGNFCIIENWMIRMISKIKWLYVDIDTRLLKLIKSDCFQYSENLARRKTLFHDLKISLNEFSSIIVYHPNSPNYK